jgi:hypothetical protein
MSRGFPLSIPNKIWKVAVSQLCMVNNGESWSVNGQSTVNPQEISVSAILVSRKLSSIIRLVIGYIYIYGIIWFYHDPHCLNWGCNWNYPCTTCETLYDVLYFHDMLNILSHIFNISLYVMEYHGISLRHILPTPIDTERARHRAPRPTPCCTARQLGQGPKCGATRRG